MDRSILERPFEDALIRSRQGPFGKTFSYVEGAEYIKRLNEALEGDWSFEIVQHQILDAEVFVLGKLVVGAICKMAFGGSSITVSRDGEVLSLADDLKAASTDSLKKCASFLGVGLHLYGSDAPTHASNGRSNGNGAATRNGNGHTHPRNHGSGNSRPNGNGSSGAPRVTQKQLGAIWSMGRALGQNADQIRARAMEVYGLNPEHLSRSDASSFITELGAALS